MVRFDDLWSLWDFPKVTTYRRFRWPVNFVVREEIRKLFVKAIHATTAPAVSLKNGPIDKKVRNQLGFVVERYVRAVQPKWNGDFAVLVIQGVNVITPNKANDTCTMGNFSKASKRGQRTCARRALAKNHAVRHARDTDCYSVVWKSG